LILLYPDHALVLLVDGGATFDAFYFVKWLINLLRFK